MHTRLHGNYFRTASNPKEDYILYSQRYIDHVLHVMMIDVLTKRKLSNAFFLHSFIGAPEYVYDITIFAIFRHDITIFEAKNSRYHDIT